MSSIEIALANTRARVRAQDDEVYNELWFALSVFAKSAPFQRSFKLYQQDKKRGKKPSQRRGWDGFIRLYDKHDDSFPAGLLGRVEKLVKPYGDIQVYDRRMVPEPHPKLVGGRMRGDPRDWQIEAFDAALYSERGVFEAATGTGKTNLIAQIVAHLGVPTLILVNRNTLATQTIQRFQNVIEFPNARNPFGMVGDGIWDPALITVATYQTLASMHSSDKKATAEFLRQFSAMHVDEAHHTPAATLYALTNETSEAYWRYGYSATPFKNDKETELRLVGVTGEVIYSYNAAKAIADGILTPPRIYMVDGGFPRLEPFDKLDEKERYMGTFAEEYKAGVVNHTGRNRMLSDIANQLADHRIPTIASFRQKDQGRALLRLIEESDFLDGHSDIREREEAKRRLMTGKLRVLVVSSIFDEGEDVPAVGALVIAGGYRAHHLTLQRIGRGLRPSEGKEEVLVFDSWDSHSYRLEQHSEERLDAYRGAGYKVEVVSYRELQALMAGKDFWR